MIKIGIIREGKTPPDARVALSPEQCVEVEKRFENVKVLVEPSEVRCFKNAEYEAAGIEFTTDLSGCDLLLGVKEVPIQNLIPGKTYLFFSHTIKKQPHNKPLLQALLDKKIRMIDYEAIVNEKGERLIAFGFYAGIVGGHNGLWTYGKRTAEFSLPRMYECHDYAEVCEAYKKTNFPPIRIVLTGGGRVASGAVKNLLDMGIKQVSPQDFLEKDFPIAVFTQIHASDYMEHREGKPFEKAHFYRHGEEYRSTFMRFAAATDVFLNGIFYDKKAPAFFTIEEMSSPDFNIQVIADITCDIAPDSSVPCTIRSTKIADPVFGFDPVSGKETSPFQKGAVDIMAIDNLPSELPRDASAFFGKQLIDNVLPELIKGRKSPSIVRGMICEDGKLTENFEYLADYAAH